MVGIELAVRQLVENRSELWAAIVATVLNYLRVSGAILHVKFRGRRAVSSNGRSGSAAMAIGSSFVPAVLV